MYKKQIKLQEINLPKKKIVDIIDFEIDNDTLKITEMIDENIKKYQNKEEKQCNVEINEVGGMYLNTYTKLQKSGSVLGLIITILLGIVALGATYYFTKDVLEYILFASISLLVVALIIFLAPQKSNEKFLEFIIRSNKIKDESIAEFNTIIFQREINDYNEALVEEINALINEVRNLQLSLIEEKKSLSKVEEKLVVEKPKAKKAAAKKPAKKTTKAKTTKKPATKTKKDSDKKVLPKKELESSPIKEEVESSPIKKELESSPIKKEVESSPVLKKPINSEILINAKEDEISDNLAKMRHKMEARKLLYDGLDDTLNKQEKTDEE